MVDSKMILNKDVIIDTLSLLSDRARSYSVLCDLSTEESSNIDEEYIYLFEDSGLGKAIDENNLPLYFSKKSIDKIMYFKKLLLDISKINYCKDFDGLKMIELSDEAKDLLLCIKEELQ